MVKCLLVGSLLASNTVLWSGQADRVVRVEPDGYISPCSLVGSSTNCATIQPEDKPETYELSSDCGPNCVYFKDEVHDICRPYDERCFSIVIWQSSHVWRRTYKLYTCTTEGGFAVNRVLCPQPWYRTGDCCWYGEPGEDRPPTNCFGKYGELPCGM